MKHLNLLTSSKRTQEDYDVMANNILQKLIDYLLLITFIVFPIAFKISLKSPEDPIHPLISANFSIADFLLVVIFVLWIIKILIYREYVQIKLPPIPIIVFVGIGALSFVNTISILEWAKGLILLIEYFLIFYLLLLNNLRKTKINTIKNFLFIATTVILSVALVQHSFLNGSPYLIRGLFENRNILGTYLCIVVPLTYSELLFCVNKYRKAWMAMLLLLSLFVITSGSAILSLVISLFFVSLVHSRKLFFKYLTGILLLIPTYIYIMPQKNINSITDFFRIYEQGNINENYNRIQSILYDLSTTGNLINKKVGNNTITISNNLFTSNILPKIQNIDEHQKLIDQKYVKSRYVEMQAAMNIMAEKSLLGVGLGNFQANIGMYYYTLPKLNTEEPYQHSGYLVIGATTGLLGLTALLWLFLFALKKSYKSFKIIPDVDKNKTYLGLFGALIACMIENFFSNVFIAVLLIPLVVLIYLSVENACEI